MDTKGCIVRSADGPTSQCPLVVGTPEQRTVVAGVANDVVGKPGLLAQKVCPAADSHLRRGAVHSRKLQHRVEDLVPLHDDAGNQLRVNRNTNAIDGTAAHDVVEQIHTGIHGGQSTRMSSKITLGFPHEFLNQPHIKDIVLGELWPKYDFA